MSLDYVLTGTGRCGTGWAARVLTSVGVLCGHEAVFRPYLTLPVTGLQGDSSWLAANRLDHPLASDAHIVHLVREPLATIRSLAVTVYRPQSMYGWLAMRMLDYDAMGEAWLDLAVRHYIGINVLIEPRADVRVRVEDGPSALLAGCGINRESEYDDRKNNARIPDDFADLTMAELDERWYEPLTRLASRYGYEVGRQLLPTESR